MLEGSKSRNQGNLNISLFQRYIFWILLFLLPITVVPLPWDWTERAMSLLILSSSVLIVGLEMIKLIWEGKVSILKSALDIGIFLLLLSILLSTIFSVDINTSIWGIDSRLGNSLILFLTILILSFSVRTFIKTEKDLKYSILFFLSGLFFNNIFSILSFFGINIWGLIPLYKELHQAGLPLLRSPQTHLLLNILSVILSLLVIGEYYVKRKGENSFILSIIFLILSILNIWLYSMNQGFLLVLTSIILILLFTIFVTRKLKLERNTYKNIFIFSLILIGTIIIPVILFQIPSIRKELLPESIRLVGQVSLGNDMSWMIGSSVLVASIFSGIFGLGVDTYSAAYYLYKPLNINLVTFNDVSFYNGANEVLTQFTNSGLLWFLIWLFFGFLLVTSSIKDIKNIQKYGEESNSWKILILNLSLVVIYISSFFIPYSVIILFILMILISLRVVTREILKRGTEDKFVLKFWAVDLTSSTRKNSSYTGVNTFLTIIISLAMVTLVGICIRKSIATLYSLKAEAFLVEENKKYTEENTPTIDDREVFVESMINYYAQAVKLDKNNTLYNRKLGLMYLERLGIAAERFSLLEEDEEVSNDLIRDIGIWKNYVIDTTRKGIDMSPAVFANWEARTRIYMGLVGMGFYDHVPDAIVSLERALQLNPFNYDLHYKTAQIYIIKGDKESALASLTRVLSINPQHIPSILLAGDFNREMGNIEIYESYLIAAKKILETQGNTENDAYREITKELNNISALKEETEEFNQDEQDDQDDKSSLEKDSESEEM